MLNNALRRGRNIEMPTNLIQEILMYEGDTKNYVQAVGNTVTPSDPSRAFPERTYMSHVSD